MRDNQSWSPYGATNSKYEPDHKGGGRGLDHTSNEEPSSLTFFLNANSSFCVSRSSSIVCFCILLASFSSSSSELSKVRMNGFGSNVFEFSLIRVAMMPLDNFSINVFELNVPCQNRKSRKELSEGRKKGGQGNKVALTELHFVLLWWWQSTWKDSTRKAAFKSGFSSKGRGIPGSAMAIVYRRRFL